MVNSTLNVKHGLYLVLKKNLFKNFIIELQKYRALYFVHMGARLGLQN